LHGHPDWLLLGSLVSEYGVCARCFDRTTFYPYISTDRADMKSTVMG
jgi:hypothetical protein